MICFFIVIINIIIWIFLIISQKYIVFAFISVEFLVLSSKFFCLLLLIIWKFIRATIFFAINITPFFSWLIAIIIIIIIMVNIVVLIVLISVIMLFKSIIYKVLNISSIVVILCYDKKSKLRKMFFKDCCKSKLRKF